MCGSQIIKMFLNYNHTPLAGKTCVKVSAGLKFLHGSSSIFKEHLAKAQSQD